MSVLPVVVRFAFGYLRPVRWLWWHLGRRQRLALAVSKTRVDIIKIRVDIIELPPRLIAVYDRRSARRGELGIVLSLLLPVPVGSSFPFSLIGSVFPDDPVYLLGLFKCPRPRIDVRGKSLVVEIMDMVFVWVVWSALVFAC